MWKGILEGKVAPSDGMDSFLHLARTIVLRRIASRARSERAGQRNRSPTGEHDWSLGSLHRFVPDDLSVFECGLPAPEADLVAHEESMWLLRLVNPAVLDVAANRLEGLTVTQLAINRGSSRRTIERILHEVMKVWLKALRDRDSWAIGWNRDRRRAPRTGRRPVAGPASGERAASAPCRVDRTRV
jgi:hypothetical protein